MQIRIFDSARELGRAAAAEGAARIRAALEQRGAANIIVATGASQFELFDQLVREPAIAWNRVTAFHLDEYVGLPIDHPASFRLYLWKRFSSRLPLPLRALHYLDGEGDARRECERAGALLRRHPVDVAFVGIGENGHLAFNDPPAEFEIEEPYLVVELDEACRRQQVGEGWFKALEEVPMQAISMSIPWIIKSRSILCSVPDQRKAAAVRACVEGPVSPDAPASILQRCPECTLYLDRPAASRLSPDRLP